jgi:4-hydroxy-tetrahydrodipicolinate synthase
MKQREFVPVMLTPFKENGEIDFKSLSELTELYIKSGASGLFSNCLSSEMFELSEEERIRLVKHVINITGGAVRVVATGTFGGDIQIQTDFIKRIYETGVDAVIVLANMLATEQEPDDVFNENMFRLLQLTENIPLGFYECPVPYKRLITPYQLELFLTTKRIIYHKDTCLNLDQVKQKLAVVKDQNLGFFDAYMVHAVDSLRAGSTGLSCIQGNYWPELIVWLCENFDNESQKEEVDKVQQFLIDKMDVMHDVYPVVAKYYLQKRGLKLTTFTRRTVGVFTENIRGNIDKLYCDYNDLLMQIGFNPST